MSQQSMFKYSLNQGVLALIEYQFVKRAGMGIDEVVLNRTILPFDHISEIDAIIRATNHSVGIC
jgi:hypothetical protein